MYHPDGQSYCYIETFKKQIPLIHGLNQKKKWDVCHELGVKRRITVYELVHTLRNNRQT